MKSVLSDAADYFAYWQARLRDANPVRIWAHPLLALDPWLLGIP